MKPFFKNIRFDFAFDAILFPSSIQHYLQNPNQHNGEIRGKFVKYFKVDFEQDHDGSA